MILESILIAGMAISSAQPQAAIGWEGVGKRGTGLHLPGLLAQAADTPSAAAATEKPKAGAEAPSNPLPRIRVVDPPRQAAWEWKDRIAWGANIILALLGYGAMMLALSTLRKIERQTKFFEEAVAQAKTAADAALLHAEALVRAERPWVMITVERSPTIANSSVIVATNRGKSPAKLIGTTDSILSAADEKQLPSKAEYGEPDKMLEPIILLPGECAEIRIFGADDVKRYCESDERVRAVEEWTERLFVYGKVVYKDLIAPADDRQVHETSWSCWYVAGKNASGLVSVSVPAFRVLT